MNDKITCSYCNTDVSAAEVEKEGGACPECGALMSGSLLFDQPGDAYEDEDNGLDDEFDD